MLETKLIAVVCACWKSCIWVICLHKPQTGTSRYEVVVLSLIAEATTALDSGLPLLEQLLVPYASACTPKTAKLIARSGLSEFYSLYRRECDNVFLVCIATNDWGLSQHSVLKDPKNFLQWHQAFKMSMFLKLPVTVGYLVRRDRGHMNIPMVSTPSWLPS